VLTEYSDRMKKWKTRKVFTLPKNVHPATTLADLLVKTMVVLFRRIFCKSRIPNPTAVTYVAAKPSARKSIPPTFHQSCRNSSSVFLTEPDDIVLDIFSGSNTTGSVAECEDRKWLAFDQCLDYLATSSFRFFSETATDAEIKTAHDSILAGETVDLRVNVLNAPIQQPRNGTFHRPVAPAQDLLILAERASRIAPIQVAKTKTVSYRRQKKRRSKISH
jgi:site-specific DNA-methyltransferase (cytosine-N4-specific)